MKKMDDEELQKWIEENKLSNKETDGLISDDAKAYQFLFDVLDQEPLQSLPYDFSAKVTRKVQEEAKRTSELRSYLTLLLVFVVAVGIIYTLLSVINFGRDQAYFNTLLEYKWAFVLTIFGLLTIQYLDQILVKANIFRR